MGKKPLALAVASACLSLYAFSSAQAAGFVEDSKATLSMRNFYINTDNRTGATTPSKVEEDRKSVV